MVFLLKNLNNNSTFKSYLMNFLAEEQIEKIALDILANDLGYENLFGPDIVECGNLL
jgi:hypothetical protein